VASALDVLIVRPRKVAGGPNACTRQSQVEKVERAMELGKHAADFVSTTFVRPVKLEFEKARWKWLVPSVRLFSEG
jgi:DNA polymerase delta subunit 1